MMRTSYTQCKILVEFMERYGDLSRAPSGPYGRYWYSGKWLELTAKLNRECTGGRSRSQDKWKKVWSDLKNNIKRKRARINKLQAGNNGKVNKCSLSDIEQRVIRIIGSKKTPHVDVAEIGLDLNEMLLETDIKVESLNQIDSLNSEVLDLDNIQDTEVLEEYSIQDSETLERDNVRGSEVMEDGPDVEESEIINNSEPTQLHSVIKEESNTINKRTKHTDHELDINERSDPSSSPSTSYEPPPPKRRRKVAKKFESKVDYIARKFLESDQNMKDFLRERERERVRQRDIELQLQDRWIDTVQQGLNIFKMIVEKWVK